MKGKISLITGPMFSGKTTWLINELSKKQSTELIAVKYFLEKRYAIDSISTHDGKKLKAESVKNESDILNLLKKNPHVKSIGIDELQFFKPAISILLSELREKNINIYAAGLNVDFRNKEWETTKKVKDISDFTKTLFALCVICGKRNATISRRKGTSKERVVIGGSDIYEPVCEKDYDKEASI